MHVAQNYVLLPPPAEPKDSDDDEDEPRTEGPYSTRAALRKSGYMISKSSVQEYLPVRRNKK